MSFLETLIIAVVSSVISGFIAYICAEKKNKAEIDKIEAEYKKQLDSYRKQTIYNIKKNAIFESLTVIDLYLSWLNYDNNFNIPCRQSTTLIDITTRARQSFNNLCITCDSEKLINLFGEIFFKKHSNVMPYYSEYRNEARKELGMGEIEFSPDVVFLSRISTKDLEEQSSN